MIKEENNNLCNVYSIIWTILFLFYSEFTSQCDGRTNPKHQTDRASQLSSHETNTEKYELMQSVLS